MNESTNQTEHRFQLVDWQDEVYQSTIDNRYTVVSAGRQSGKTHLAILTIWLYAINNPESVCWWVAPTYAPAEIAFRRLLALIKKHDIAVKSSNKSSLRVEFTNGSIIDYRSAEREDTLRGETVNFLVVDEMGLVKRDAWEFALRGTITATGAHVLFIGTPKGKNTFYDLFVRGMDAEQKDYKSFQIPSNRGLQFPQEEWLEVQRLPLRIFQQEYEARFIDDGGEVFRNIRDCVRGSLEPKPMSRKTYYAGIDLAKSFDYTVICVFDSNGHLVAFDRFNDVAWSVQKNRIIKTLNHYNAFALIDSTGIGDPIFEDLEKVVRCEGFKFTNVSKRQIIENLAIEIERGTISFPDIPELINELSIYTFEQLPSGSLRYSAPSGMHDDIVTALALACWAWCRTRGGNDAISATEERMFTVDAW